MGLSQWFNQKKYCRTMYHFARFKKRFWSKNFIFKWTIWNV